MAIQRHLRSILLLCGLTLLWVGLSFAPAYPVQAATEKNSPANMTAKLDYAGKNLQQTEFMDMNLEGADFSKADLAGAVFKGTNVKQANFRDANLSDSIAYVVDFAGADLTHANFSSAMLLRSNFRGAIATGSDFSMAVLDKDQVIALCETASGAHPTTGVDTRESLGCR